MKEHNYIDGRWRACGAATAIVRNPSNLDEVVGEYGWADAELAEEALAAARRAAPAWAEHNPQARSDMLRSIAGALEQQAPALGRLLSREEGKVLSEGVAEVRRSAQIFHYFAGEAIREAGAYHRGLRDGMDVAVTREPLGVVALITPWNFPLAVPAWKLAAALAYGNTAVLKPSEHAPAVVVALVKICVQAGLPQGVVNLLVGAGSELGAALIAGADGVSFTGATPTGRRILEHAAKAMTKVQLELGGKNALIVTEDCDLDLAAELAAQGAFYQTGQRCTATSRLIVYKAVHDAFVEKLAARMRSIRVGHALDPQSTIGPVATRAQLEKNLAALCGAKAEGAACVLGGDLLEAATPGHFMAPALLVETSPAMRINQEEVFGPVASVIAVSDLDEAIAVANNVEFALSAGICTRRLSVADAFRRRSRAGMVMINAPTAGVDYHVPFGGRPPSGYGPREQGAAAGDFFTESKTAYLNFG